MRILTIVSILMLLVNGCTRTFYSNEVGVQCNIQYDKLSVTLTDQTSGETQILVPSANGSVFLERLEDDFYTLEATAELDELPYSMATYQDRFKGSNEPFGGGIIFPMQPTIDLDYYIEQEDQRFLLLDLELDACTSLDSVFVYVFGEEPTELTSSSIAHADRLEVDQAPMLMPEDRFWMVLEVEGPRSERRRYSSRSNPIYVDIDSLTNANDTGLVLKDSLMEFDLEGADGPFEMEVYLEEGKFYHLEVLTGDHYSEYTAKALVASMSGYFREGRTAGRRGFARHFMGQETGRVSFDIAVPVEGTYGTFGVILRELEVETQTQCGSVFQFQENSQTQVCFMDLDAGSHFLEWSFDASDDRMFMHFSLFDVEKNAPLDFFPTQSEFQFIGPYWETGPFEGDKVFNLSEHTQIAIAVTSGYTGTSNSITIQVQ